MYNTERPSPGDLPSSRALLRATLIAAGVAALLLVTVVMPAEYGVDPTGVGSVLGLERMGEIKRDLAAAATQETSTSASGATPAAAPVANATPGATARAAARVATTRITDEGALTAAFGGMHGWFWRNRTSAPVTVTLFANGAYTEWKEIE